jgi:hypothetical protein
VRILPKIQYRSSYLVTRLSIVLQRFLGRRLSDLSSIPGRDLLPSCTVNTVPVYGQQKYLGEQTSLPDRDSEFIFSPDPDHAWINEYLINKIQFRLPLRSNYSFLIENTLPVCKFEYPSGFVSGSGIVSESGRNLNTDPDPNMQIITDLTGSGTTALFAVEPQFTSEKTNIETNFKDSC